MKTIKSTAITIMAIILLNNMVTAGNIKNPIPASARVITVEPLSVSFLGADADYLYFQVAVTAGNHKVAFEVSDKEEGSLYSNYYIKDNVKIYKIERREGQQLDFNLKAGKQLFTWSFSDRNTASLYTF